VPEAPLRVAELDAAAMFQTSDELPFRLAISGPGFSADASATVRLAVDPGADAWRSVKNAR